MADIDEERLQLVHQRAQLWAKELIELNHRNTLVNFRFPKTRCIELTECEPTALENCLRNKRTSLRALFTDEEDHSAACVHARNVHKQIVSLREEQGIEVGRLASGLVRVVQHKRSGLRAPVPLRAPLLLRPVVLSPKTATESDFALQADVDVELNPVLLHALQREYGLDLESGELDALADQIKNEIAELDDTDTQIDSAFSAIAAAATVRGIDLELERCLVIGLFNYQKMPMVRDLEQATELLARHEVVAAIAECPRALEALGATNGCAPRPADQIPPEDDFLVQKADSSQQLAIEIALTKKHLHIEGPPGTGKSQTIANIIAGAAANRLHVLFVAEKQAAIEAVTSRLATVGLGDLVLDLHGKTDKKRVAGQLAESLDRLTSQPPVDCRGIHSSLVERRRQLITHVQELHSKREPWAISAYRVREKLLELGSAYQLSTAIRGERLRALDAIVATQVEELLRTYVERGGLRLLRQESPWWRADVTQDDLPKVRAELDAVTRETLVRSDDLMRGLVARVGLPAPRDIAGWEPVLDLMDRVADTVQMFGSEIFGDHLDRWRHAAAPRSERKQDSIRSSWLERRKLVKQARSACRSGITRKAELHTALCDAIAHRGRWRELAGSNATPVTCDGLSEVADAYRRLRNQLAAIALSTGVDNIEARSMTEAADELDALRADESMLWVLPGLLKTRRELEALGLDELLAEIASRNPNAEQATSMFRHTWLRCLDDEFRFASEALRSFTPQQHDRLVQEFQEADRAHLRANAQRVRRIVAETLREARDEHPEQTTTVKREASKRRRLLPLRTLVDRAPDVLLALRPCWAMSPLVASQALPRETLFDIVIFDEASQVKPHDAITSIMRARHLVVAGDDKQLPPTNFFDRQFAAVEEQDEDELDLRDYDSILDSLRAILPNSCRLRWHYRSQDERLIAFSNEEIYRRDLVTFPGARRKNPLRFELVNNGVASPGQGSQSAEEVRRVVELVLEHAEQRPHQSLGVITLNAKHQNRVEGEIRRARRDRPDLDEFFAADTGPNRHFFVKNIETVQGDERDSIILTIGIAKTAAGTVNRTAFGVLNQEVGARRLNVAVTRARQTLTVVSSFRAGALEPSETKTGTELLRRFLEMAEREIDPSEVGRTTGRNLNAFERDIARRLTAAGIDVYPQWGVSSYSIDLALAHPTKPGEMVLAVEADGDRYHNAKSTRDRDRLRQEHLERLGWRFHRVWASAWFADPDIETDKIVAAWRSAVDGWEMRQREGQSPSAAYDDPSMEAAIATALDRGPRPNLPYGLPIMEYSHQQLVSFCRWLMRDGLAIDTAERVAQAMAELGFRKRGRIIVERLSRAAKIAQEQIDREDG